MSSQILAFKLNSGDEIIAEVTALNFPEITVKVDSDGLQHKTAGPLESYTVRRPMTIQFQPVSPTKMGLALVPWTLSNPTIVSMEIPAKSVLLTFEPSDNVAKQYTEQTSGLAIATSMPPAPEPRISR